MATVLQITASSSSSMSMAMAMGTRSSSLSSSSFNGGLTTPRSTVHLSSLGLGTTTNSRLLVGLRLRLSNSSSSSSSSFRGLVVKAAAAAVSAPKYTSLKPLGDRVLVKVKKAEEKTAGGILIPTSAQTKSQGGEVVAVGVGKTIGEKKVDISVKSGAKVLYSKYAGTEVEFDGTNHLILKEDDIVGILENDDVKDLKPLNDRVLIKVAEVEEMTAGGLMLTEASKQKPSIGTVVAIGPGPLDEEGNRKGLTVTTGSTVLYSKYAGSDYKAGDGSDYIVIRESDVMAVLS